MLFLLLFGFAINFAFAQERTVTGSVTSEEGESLPGVNIVIQGTTQGSISDPEGNYTVVVPDQDAVLVFSFIGFTTQAVPVGNKSSINIVLVLDVTALDEIVITGYGTQKKKEVTGAISSVKSDEFNQGYVNSPTQLLQGKVAGLSISKPGGNPNEGYYIRLRGLSTIRANTQPLMIID